MKSLKKELATDKEEIIEYARKYGVLPAMDKAGKKSLDCFQRWLREVAPDEHFTLFVECKRNQSIPLREKLVQKTLSRMANLETMARLEAENADLDKDIRMLEWQLCHLAREKAKILI